jgi:hypothetical protein
MIATLLLLLDLGQGEPAALPPPAAADEEVVEELEIVEEVDESDTWYGEAWGQADRALDLLTARPAREGSFVGHSFLGFDGGGLKIGLGLRYGVLDDLDVGVFRLNGSAEAFDTYDLDLRYQLLTQTRHPLDLAVRGGITWFAQPGVEDAHGLFAQLLASRVLANRFLVGTALMFHSDSSSDRKPQTAPAHSIAVSFLAEARLLAWLALDAESAINLAGYHQRYPTLSLAAKLLTHRHTFAVAVSNTQYIAADGLVANSRRGRADQLVLGFNITREL